MGDDAGRLSDVSPPVVVPPYGTFWTIIDNKGGTTLNLQTYEMSSFWALICSLFDDNRMFLSKDIVKTRRQITEKY